MTRALYFLWTSKIVCTYILGSWKKQVKTDQIKLLQEPKGTELLEIMHKDPGAYIKQRLSHISEIQILVYCQMKENLGKSLVRQITIVMVRIDLLCINTMKWGPDFREFRFSCGSKRFGTFFSEVKSIKFFIPLHSCSWRPKILSTPSLVTYIECWISAFLDGCQSLIMNVWLQEFLELAQSVRDPGNKVVHPTEICNYKQSVFTVKLSVLFQMFTSSKWKWHCSTGWPSFLSASRRFWNSVWKISRCFSIRTCSHLRASSSCVLSWRYTCTRRCSSSNRASACTHKHTWSYSFNTVLSLSTHNYRKCMLKYVVKPKISHKNPMQLALCPIWIWTHSHVILSLVYLFHVFGNRVLLEELCAFPCIEALGVCQKLRLKVLLVYW